MAVTEPRRTLASTTHEVFNQPPPLAGYNAFEQDRPLAEALEREGGGWAADRAAVVGEVAGGQALEWGRQANQNPRSCAPTTATEQDRRGRVPSRVALAAEHRSIPCAPRPALARAATGAHAARGAMFMVMGQAEGGHGCPVSMTYAAVPALRTTPELAAEWEPLLTSTAYDPRLVPAADKAGALCGMSMTEKQGGSDGRANTTTARALNGGGPGEEYELTGHKWFCSAPMCDVFLMPRTPRAGSPASSCRACSRRHAQRLPYPAAQGQARQPLQRLQRDRARRHLGKDGGRAGARRPDDHRDGEPHAARLHAGVGRRDALWRRQATHHAAHRSAFGKLLADQPLMRNVLADPCVESEAATVTVMRVARAYDVVDDERETLFKRLATAVCKYWLCKRGPMHAAEALECLGGAGYVEESDMPRLYRESPLNSIWEGSGNVICLDVLRAIARSPQSLAVFLDEVREAGGGRAAACLVHRQARGAAAGLRRHACPGAGREPGACAAGIARFATATRLPTPSARRGLTASGAAPSGPCRPASTSPP